MEVLRFGVAEVSEKYTASRPSRRWEVRPDTILRNTFLQDIESGHTVAETASIAVLAAEQVACDMSATHWPPRQNQWSPANDP